MNQSFLTNNLGLTDKEAAVYLAILELGSSSIQPIATQSGVKRTSIYYFIDHLVELGIIEKIKLRNRWHWQAKSPEALIDLQQRRLSDVKNALPELKGIFNLTTDKPKISYFEGVVQMKNILWEEIKCKKELLGIWSGQEVADLFGASLLDEVDRKRRAKGIAVRVIRVLEVDAPFEAFREQPGSNRELRYAPKGTRFPMAMTIYDTGKVSFMSSKKEGFGFIIESAEFYAVMKALFEGYWGLSQSTTNNHP